VTDVGESCDDGNTVGGDGCSAICELESCGNGVLDVGEGCDDGNTAGGDGCSAICQVEVCGNGVLDPGEDCDDGNTADGDGCSAVCTGELPVPVLGPWAALMLGLLLLAIGGVMVSRRGDRVA
jgi:cysteine-rich repeat protein